MVPFSSNNIQEFAKSSGFEVPQTFFDQKTWNLAGQEKVDIQYKIGTSGKTLAELGAKIRLGIATGSNEAFLINEETRKLLLSKAPKNNDIIKPVLRGQNIGRFRYTLSGQYILLTKNGVCVETDYPDIFAHLDSFGDDFKNRGAQGKHWTNLRACSFFDDFKKEKIVWIELTDIGRFALCREEVYLLNSAYFLLPPKGLDAKYLLGILNSSTIRFYLNQAAATSGMGTSRWIKNYVKTFAIPQVPTINQRPLIRLVDDILEAKDADPNTDTSTLEVEIDRMVYQLYGLTEEEVAVVEGR